MHNQILKNDIFIRARRPNSIMSLTSCQRSVHSSTHRCTLNFIQSFWDRVISGLHFDRFFFQKILCLHVVVTVRKKRKLTFFRFRALPNLIMQALFRPNVVNTCKKDGTFENKHVFDMKTIFFFNFDDAIRFLRSFCIFQLIKKENFFVLSMVFFYYSYDQNRIVGLI